MKPITSLLRALDIYKEEGDAELYEKMVEILHELDDDLFAGEYEASDKAIKQYIQFDMYLDTTYAEDEEEEYDDYDEYEDDDIDDDEDTEEQDD